MHGQAHLEGSVKMDIGTLIVAVATALLSGGGIFLWSAQRYKLRAEALKAESEALKARSEALKADAEARSEEAEAEKTKAEASASLSTTALAIVARWEVRVKALEAQADEYATAYKALQGAYDSLQQEFRREVCCLTKQLEEVRAENQALKTESEALKQRVLELERENKDLRCGVKGLAQD